MFGIDDALIAGGMSLLGGLFNNNSAAERQEATNQFNAEQAGINREFNAAEAEKARGFNSEQAEVNRRFQEIMSSTAYQRGIADMKAAGLNPMLAYSKGGASAPSGSAASAGAASGSSASGATAPSSDVITPAVHTALAVRQNAANVANMEQQNVNMKSQNELTKAQEIQSLHTTAKIIADQRNVEADTMIKQAELPKRQEEALSAKYDNSAKKADSDQRGTFAGEWARRIGTSAKDALSVIPFTPGGR